MTLPPPPGDPSPVSSRTRAAQSYPPPGHQDPDYQYLQPGAPARWYQEQPTPKPGHAVRNILLSVAAGVVLLSIVVVAVTRAHGSPPRNPPVSAAAAARQSASGSAGTTLTVTGTDDNGNAVAYDVTLIAVNQDAAPASSADAPSPGYHLASAEFRIAGRTGSARDNANLDAEARGTDQAFYQASVGAVAAGADFSGGQFSIAPGRTETGYVSFMLPDSVRLTSVTWRPQLTSDALTTWNLVP
jgi:hypothetical protein